MRLQRRKLCDAGVDNCADKRTRANHNIDRRLHDGVQRCDGCIFIASINVVHARDWHILGVGKPIFVYCHEIKIA